MPNCFQLINKETGEPAIFSEVDDAMRKAFNEPANPKQWLYHWYDIVGLTLACGRTLDDCRAMYANDTDLLKVIEYLDKNYTSTAWAER